MKENHIEQQGYGNPCAETYAGAPLTKVHGVCFFDPEALRCEAKACMEAMDNVGIPRHDENNMEFSIWGRACWMARNSEKMLLKA